MKKPLRRAEWVILTLIILLAAGLRLTRLDLIEFKYDEATVARTALRIAREGDLPALGMVSSQGPHNPPLMSYVLSPAFAISRDPRLAAGWVAFLGVVAVGLTYWVGRSYFSWPVAAVASVLFAASPWAVFLSRKIWAQTLPALTLVFVGALLALVARRRQWALTVAFAAAAGLVSLHLGGLAFFFVLAAVMALFPRRVRLLPLAIGIVLVLIVLSPYLVYDARHEWQNMRAFASMRDQEAIVDLQALRIAAVAASGFHLEDLAGERYEDFLGRIVDIRWLDQVEMALLWLGLLWTATRVVRATVTRRRLPPAESARLVLLAWFAVPVALLLRRTEPLHPHTVAFLYPVQHLVIALLVVDAATWTGQRLGPGVRRALTVGVVALVAAIVGWQIYLQQSLLDFVETHDTPGGYGAPVRHPLAASRRAKDVARESGADDVISLLPGGDPRYDGAAAVFDVLLPPGSRLVDGRRALVVPAAPTVYLVAPGAESAAWLVETLADEAAAPLPVRFGNEDTYRFFHWQPADIAPRLSVDSESVRWESGVTLLGYDWEGEAEPGGTVRWTLYVRVDSEPPPGSDLHWFNHLVDGEGNRWGQSDGVGYPASEWRAGDTVVAWFDIAISPDGPAPPYGVRSGMYAYPEIVNVSLVDAAGNAAGQFVELGPIGPGP